MSVELRDRDLFNIIVGKYARKDLVESSSLARKYRLMAAIGPVLEKLGNLGTIIDIGCGIGSSAKYLEGLYEHYIGIDQSDEMVRYGKLIFQDNTKVELLALNVKSQQLPQNVADVILSLGALHHMTELDEVIQSLTRMAKPGASLIAIEPQRKNPLLQLMRHIRGLVDSSYSKEQSYFTGQELKNLFQKHGLTDISISYYGFISPPFAEIIFQPQALAIPLSRLAVACDRWLDSNLPGSLKILSFGLIIRGKFKSR
ncbi:MAG TPA: class I SAM-dependent methyltransferase [archaeon]|nr:class I SAM-dependent methyltransferase [archaeon]